MARPTAPENLSGQSWRPPTDRPSGLGRARLLVDDAVTAVGMVDFRTVVLPTDLHLATAPKHPFFR
jgi:hypothetical protein